MASPGQLRGSPLDDIDQSPAFDLTKPAPAPEVIELQEIVVEDEVDQTASW